MAYVVTQSCIGNKHTSCVDVCPVEAFREAPEMLFIDPDTCIDCNACVSACPEGAIFPRSMVPEDQQSFITLNAEGAKTHPVIRESIQTGQHAASPLARLPARFAIVGSGPSGFYAAEALMKQMPAARIDMFERLPTPFGLVRYGVAPDHPRIKSVTAGFERIAESAQFRFFGNVHIGQDLSSAELRQHYHGVVYATGGSQSRALSLPGADSKNIFGSSNFVGWYNGHPDEAQLAPALAGPTAVIIGIGNVALDIARLLVLPQDQLAKTDIADDALHALAASGIEEVRLLARRGPAQAAFTPKELEQLMGIDGLQLLVDPADLELDDATARQLEQPEFAEARQNLILLREIAARPQAEGKRIRFMFYTSPTGFSADNGQVSTVHAQRTELVRNDQGDLIARLSEQTLDIPASLVVHAIGYQGSAIDELPFDTGRGVIQHEQGRITGHADARDYVAGWIKRGASGVIGSNRQCATESVQRLLDDLGSSLPAVGDEDIDMLLKARQVDTVSLADWRLLDQHEQARGRSQGRTRRKIVNIEEMLTVIRDARAREAEQARMPVKTHHRACTLCEAMCGVVIKTQGEQILSIAGDPDDPHSLGHICPKGYSLQDLHTDPDRLRTPLEKVNGEWLPIDWDSALDKVAAKLVDIQQRHGNDSIAGYWGNPASHNLGLMMASGSLRKAIGTRNISSAASLDQMPHQLVSYLMFGHSTLFTIPDIDRTQYMLMLGANPAVSNGSLMTAGDILKRMENIRERGGKIILVDPRRTESARYVDQHLFIRPGTDAFFLLGLIRHVLDKGLTKPGRLRELADNWDALEPLFDGISLEQVSARCGIAVEDIKRIAEDFAAAECAVCYGRMGVATQSYGALNHWLMLVLNILTGNLDRPGGMMFTTPAFNKAQSRPMGSFNTYQSRARGLPEFDSYFPAVTLAEEMLTPGEGQVRGFICVAGNPVLSTPNGRQMDEALEQLEFMVSIDFYLNETSRHADIILPPTGPLEHEQYDIVFNMLAVRNLARFSDPVFEPAEDARGDWDIVQGLTDRIMALKNPDGAPARKAPTPEQILDHGLKTGPYGQGFTEYNSGEPVQRDEPLSLEVLKRYPHGLDLGPMRESFPGYLFTADNTLHLTPTELVTDLGRALADLRGTERSELMLIGRRDLRTNNSWMHNSQRLVKGSDRCALMINPADAARLGLETGKQARIMSRTGELLVSVQISDDIMPGVVSLPHGWGHDREGVSLRVAQSNPGINVNDITDDQVVDVLSGNAVFNGIPVSVVAV
ncbi:molybdopterin-dependent oxidoreductase [Pseudomonas sp. gcc21]|uniref:molybdopterin-dependent oxidoreductase n=1 Tax=Pseudomonas sp. gcc21 TaxID=2726989 RepID=UPI001451CDEA|nr:molybdopterin-dependent oxidoreductase [Pseudomonas sp. gcc21]QJD57864.1 molybdopterin-dependent oxidoreductase [Pseudomonas sp. gcc21]